MRLIDFAGLVLVQLIWGFHVSVAKVGLTEFPSLFLMGARFAVVAALLCPFVPLPRRKVLPILGLSVTFGTLNFGLFYCGVAHLDAGTSAILGQAQVPFAAILAGYVYHDRFGWRRLAGLLLSLVGIVLIVGEPRIGSNVVWALSILASSVAAAAATLQIKALGPIGSFTLSGWLALFAAPQLLACSFLLEDGQWAAVRNATWRGWASLGYTVLVVAIGSYCLWYPLVRRYQVNQVMPFTLLIPVFGVLSGMLMLGETQNVRSLLGGLATVAGVAVIVLSKPRGGQSDGKTCQGGQDHVVSAGSLGSAGCRQDRQ
jgi:O-acetylserine/cysteine efflux transporter